MERRPKPVFAVHFQDFAGVGRRPELQDELDGLIESIERGDGAPEGCYRAGVDRDEDGLLDRLGIMHLHLGGRHSDVLVFLIQYADRVVLLETNSHMHFRTEPAGKNILALSQAWLAELEEAVQEAASQASAARSEGERRQAEERSRRLAASVAALMAKTPIK